MLDDTPAATSRNRGQAVSISTYEGDEGDKELLRVLAFLKRRLA